MEPTKLFCAGYSAEVLDRLPPGTAVVRVYQPSGRLEGGRDGLIVRIKPARREEWVGVFAFGERDGSALSGLYRCPDPAMLCVISRGRALMVRPERPQWVREIPVFPVRHIVAVPAEDLVVFGDSTSLCAWNRTELAWTSEPLVCGGLRILGIKDLTLHCEGVDPKTSAPVPFTVDARTGRRER